MTETITIEENGINNTVSIHDVSLAPSDHDLTNASNKSGAKKWQSDY